MNKINWHFFWLDFWGTGIVRKCLVAIAHFHRNLALWWYKKAGLCNRCGYDCGFDSTISRHGFLCNNCHEFVVKVHGV